MAVMLRLDLACRDVSFVLTLLGTQSGTRFEVTAAAGQVAVAGGVWSLGRVLAVGPPTDQYSLRVTAVTQGGTSPLVRNEEIEI